MPTRIVSRTSHQYLGNSNTMEVHNLHTETTGCQIAEIIAAHHAVVFTPDLLTQARSEGYDPCAHCLARSTR